jgi:hypothetical protein
MFTKFTITGYATGGDIPDIKKWLEDSINDYNHNPKVVDSFVVSVEEIEDD